jgi:thioredoxin-like negative regulator of GroEL
MIAWHKPCVHRLVQPVYSLNDFQRRRSPFFQFPALATGTSPTRDCSLTLAEIYTQRAIAERAAAAIEALPLRKQQLERSARRWEEMAQQAEDTERKAEINQAEKRAKSAPYYAQQDNAE